MYLAAVILLMLVLPAASVAIEALRTPGAADLMALIGKWFTFGAVCETVHSQRDTEFPPAIHRAVDL